VEPRLKPEPVTVTDVPADPEVGERTILGMTVNVFGEGPTETPLGVPVTVMVYAPYVDPTPTLKLADVIDPPLNVHAIVSIFSCVSASSCVAVIIHPVSVAVKPNPVIVTTVPVRLAVGG